MYLLGSLEMTWQLKKKPNQQKKPKTQSYSYENWS